MNRSSCLKVAIWVAGIGLLVIAACTVIFAAARHNYATSMTPPGESIAPPGGEVAEYLYLTWFDEERLVTDVATSSRPRRYDYQILQMNTDGSDIEPMPLPDHPDCHPGLQGFVAPERLPDGRLGYMVVCRESAETTENSLYMMAYDMETEQAEMLLPYSLPAPGTGRYVWSADMSRAVSGNGHGAYLSEGLHWLSAEGMQDIDVGLGQAFSPTWSPDQEQIAFSGAEDEGYPGLREKYGIYLMSPDDSQSRQLLVKGRYGTTNLNWSPDGRWIVFTADGPRLNSYNSLLLLGVESGQISELGRTLGKTGFASPAWSPDSRQLAYIWFTYEDAPDGSPGVFKSRIYVMDLPSELLE